MVVQQPVQLSDNLNGLLLSMCEDLVHRRMNLNCILEACESQNKTTLLPPPSKVIRQLVEEVLHESVSASVIISFTIFCLVIFMCVKKSK